MSGAKLSAEVCRLLDRSRVGHLATADAAARPHVVPLCFARQGDAIYFVIDEKPKSPGKKLKRLRNIEENPFVSLVVDVYEEDWNRLEYALIRGRAAKVEDADEYARALGGLRGRYPQYVTMRLTQNRNPMIRISVDAVHHWRAAPI